MPLLTSLLKAHSLPLAADGTKVISPARTGEEFGSPEFWCKVIISVFLVLLGGVFSGCVNTHTPTGKHKARGVLAVDSRCLMLV
jgi:hypothetical protein